jgi:hypothetical protein
MNFAAQKLHFFFACGAIGRGRGAGANTIAAATSCPWTPPPLPRASLCCRRRRHFALSTLTFLSTFCGTLAMAHAAGNSVEAVIDLGAEPSFEVGAWPVASDDDDGRW